MAGAEPISLRRGIFDLVLLGDNGVGKSCFINSYHVKGQYRYFKTIAGAPIWSMMVPLDHDEEMRLRVWDTTGGHGSGSFNILQCMGTHAAIVVYDITNQRTFEKAKTWVKRLQKMTRLHIFIALAGNKADLVSGREVKYEDAQSYADDNNLDLFMEVSAKTGENVENLFLTVVGYNLHMANISAAEIREKIHKERKALFLRNRKNPELTEVKILHLSHNNLTELPTRANMLTNLTMLILNHNKLTQLPESVVELIHLICLYVDNNQLSLLPASMKRLKNLQELDLRNNKLKRICIEDISDLKHLTKLSVEGNPLTLEVIRSLLELRAKNPGHINIDVAGEH
ncbi:Ras- protein Rab-5B [Desmophyllum pertusum]|uniref:Ras- protein Rab-5B n=1 Tax=Desmophyllum pertusum TaxID=174260 RepID=A0A9X0D402_9CNID|nr:Ras- protein Rab-5B [Desmophyllum pertusum]